MRLNNNRVRNTVTKAGYQATTHLVEFGQLSENVQSFCSETMRFKGQLVTFTCANFKSFSKQPEKFLCEEIHLKIFSQ